MKMKLEEHLNQLPKHSAEAMIWDNIDQKLLATSHFSDKLPQHKANPDLWYAIEDQLKKNTPHRFLRLRYLSAAASIAVIMTLGTVYFTHNTQEHIYYTESVYVQQASIDDVHIQEVDVLNNCNEYPAVCSTPDFTRLKSSLDQLKREELKLRGLKKATNDPKMALYHSRIVKNIQQVEAQMIQMFS